MAELVVREAHEADYGAIAAIYNEAIAQGGITMDGLPITEAAICAIALGMGEREMYLVAEISGRVIGWGVIKRYSDRLGYQFCCETSIYLTRHELGKGYGKVLQTAIMERVSQFGYRHIVAKILAANNNSVRFHEYFGFETVGVQKKIGFMNERWLDVVIMQCLLPY
ncbi:MAG: N-acetyltransferase family protein [Cyanobacteria bacterium J06626_6]